MIKVLLFASLREQLDCDQLDVQPNSTPCTVADLVTQLVKERGAKWQGVLQDAQVMVAVNQEVAELSALINSGDEVAFFPPVTGG